MHTDNFIAFIKTKWKDLNYDEKWFKLTCIVAPFIYIFPYLGIFIYNAMNKYFNGICSFKLLTGFYCPGCGITRATILLSKFHFVQSFFMHPFPLYAMLVFSYFFIKNVLYFISKGKVKSTPFKNWYIYVAFILIVINFLVRNLFLIFGIDVYTMFRNLF